MKTAILIITIFALTVLSNNASATTSTIKTAKDLYSSCLDYVSAAKNVTTATESQLIGGTICATYTESFIEAVQNIEREAKTTLICIPQTTSTNEIIQEYIKTVEEAPVLLDMEIGPTMVAFLKKSYGC